MEENTLTLHHFVQAWQKIVIAPFREPSGAWLPGWRKIASLTMSAVSRLFGA
jgi:hypothetical protein